MTDLRSTLRHWCVRNAPALSRAGVTVELGNAYSDKPAAWVNLDSGDRIGHIVVWTSGEVEAHAGDLPSRCTMISEYVETATAETLTALLDRVAATLSAADDAGPEASEDAPGAPRR